MQDMQSGAAASPSATADDGLAVLAELGTRAATAGDSYSNGPPKARSKRPREEMADDPDATELGLNAPPVAAAYVAEI
jgi:hypothetical protein